MKDISTFITKEDLEQTYNKEKGYYKSYSWFEDLICNVCGRIILLEREGFEMEQEFIDNENETINFCSTCKILPNKKDLVKFPNKKVK